MKKTIMFLLQNGIGFGHFKLALTIADRIDKTKYDVVFFTQAKSTRMFSNRQYKVYNIPPIYSLKTNNEILLMHTLVDRLINELQPSLVIEDTYPDSFYLNLPSLHYIPKVLIINRLMATEFENYYYDGVLGQYKHLLCLKKKEDFISGITSIEVRNFLEYSKNITYYDGVFNQPSEEICTMVREKYSFDKFGKNVVVNCGAGGWHIGENVCHTIFLNVVKAANIVNCNTSNVQFLLLMGPYSRYIEEKLRPLVTKSENVRFIDFDDNSDAMFNEADLVILRPGYNSTMEALSGKGNIILIPGISYLEEQTEWCEELKQLYGISYVSIDKIDNLADEVIRNLALNSPQRKPIINNVNDIAKKIEKLCLNRTAFESYCAFGVEYTGKSSQLLSLIERLIELGCFVCEGDNVCFEHKYIPIINRQTKPQICPPATVMAFCVDEKFENRDESFYQKRYHYDKQGVISIPMLEHIVINSTTTINKIMNILGEIDRFPNCIIIKVDESVCNVTEGIKVLEWLVNMIECNNILLTTIQNLICETVTQKFHTYKFNHYRPEITKLTK